MPDIAMCKGRTECPLCLNCLRKNAKPDKYQSYFTTPPAEKKYKDNGLIREYWDCEYYMRS